MSPGFKLPEDAAGELVPGPTALEEGLDSIRRGLDRLRTETRRSPHPVLGQLTLDQWTQVHCRHAELHLSFLIPVD
jgi:hypothetical protein